MAAHARLKNEFTEDEKYNNLMTWLKYGLYASLGFPAIKPTILIKIKFVTSLSDF